MANPDQQEDQYLAADSLKAHLTGKFVVVGCTHHPGDIIRHDVRRGAQIFTGSRSQVHDALDTIQHISGLPSGHRHVLKRFSGL